MITSEVEAVQAGGRAIGHEGGLSCICKCGKKETGLQSCTARLPQDVHVV